MDQAVATAPDALKLPLSKRAMDLALTLPALFLLALPLALVALAIKIDNPGPVFFRQSRHGLGGRVFGVFKFRSMLHNPGADFVQARQGDSRVTRVGAFIRRTSIDELPQLINVLRGEMSLVGPRPHPLLLDEQFAQHIPGLMDRYRATPGITGWAQINGSRGETRTLEDMQRRIDHDMAYIADRSLWLDLRIVAATAVGGWTDPNAY